MWGEDVMSESSDRLDPAVLKLAGVLVVGIVAPLLDSTVVNVALRTLSRELATSLATAQWVASAYLLAVVVAVPVTRWAQVRYRAKRLWLAALAIFLAGSVASANAWGIGALIAFRVMQGFAAGLMMTGMVTMVMQAAGGRRIGKLVALITLPALVGPILGPVVGGLILGHLSWRWIFYLNVPICLAAFLLAWRTVPADRPGGSARLDRIGLLLLSPALAALTYGLTQVAEKGGFAHASVIIPLAAGMGLLTLFIAHALRVADPLIDLRLLRTRSFAASCALLFASGLSLFGSLLLLPIFFQQLRGQTVIATGLLLAPQGLGSLIARPVGAVTDHVGPRPVIFGSLVLTAAAALAFSFAGSHTSVLVLSAILVVFGFGISSANMGVTVGAFTDLTQEQIPHASSMVRVFQQLGGAFGAAMIATVLQRQLAAAGVAGQPTAFSHTFWWIAACALLAAILALLLPRAHREPSAGLTGASPTSGRLLHSTNRPGSPRLTDDAANQATKRLPVRFR
jgi:EmrB/QacA subfamily drug resistance transporter